MHIFNCKRIQNRIPNRKPYCPVVGPDPMTKVKAKIKVETERLTKRDDTWT